MIVGLISDTHGVLRPEAVTALTGSDHIIHAGDIGGPAIVESLAAIAPVTVVRGNNDQGPWAAMLPLTVAMRFGGVGVLIIHDLKLLDFDTLADDIQVVVSGHSHKPGTTERYGRLLVNPGSAGPQRFRLPVSVGRLLIAAGRVEPSLQFLQSPAVGHGSRLPGDNPADT